MHGLAPPGDRPHRLPELAPALDVDARGRLVEHQQVGVADQRSGEPDPLRLAARQLGGPLVGELRRPRSGAVRRRPRAGAGSSEAISATSSRTLRCSSGDPVCSMPPTQPARTAAAGGMPKTETVPASGRVRPSIMSMVVDLPAPFGPSSATVSPGRDRQVDRPDRAHLAVGLGKPGKDDASRASVAITHGNQGGLPRAALRSAVPHQLGVTNVRGPRAWASSARAASGAGFQDDDRAGNRGGPCPAR